MEEAERIAHENFTTYKVFPFHFANTQELLIHSIIVVSGFFVGKMIYEK